MKRACVGFVVLSWSVLVPGVGRAQESGETADEAVAPDGESEAEEIGRIHFQSGRSHFDAGRYEEALSEFNRVFEMTGRIELLCNIGPTHERLGNYGEAADALDRFNQSKPEPDATSSGRCSSSWAVRTTTPKWPSRPRSVPTCWASPRGGRSDATRETRLAPEHSARPRSPRS
jgi:tetratricopeptide (TPR) repeat protein